MRKIFIIEDETDALLILKSILQKKGYDILVSSSGSMVLNLAEEFKPDIVILDIKLDKNYDGKNICSEIKKNPATRNIKVILCSAYAMPSGKSFGCNEDAFIQKPFTGDQLLNKITELLAVETPREAVAV